MARKRKINRQYMEVQADRIEMVLASHRVPVRVDGGAVLPRWLRFNLTPAPQTRIRNVRNLAEELALALGADDVRVARDGHHLTLEIPRDDSEAVELLPMMEKLPRTAPMTACLGLAENGHPLLIRLSSPDVAHVLVAGTTGSGKTALMRSMLLSLAVANPQRKLQMVLIDPKARGFRPLAGLPHLLAPLLDDVGSVVQVLHKLLDEMVRRDQQQVSSPHIVIAIDEVVELLMQGGRPVLDALTRLAQRGREAGMHLLVGAQKPASQVFGTQLKANLPVRLVGRVSSAQDALVAAGIGGSGAERLLGRGDFIAVASGQASRFQAAYIDEHEIERLVAGLAGHRQVIFGEGRLQ